MRCPVASAGRVKISRSGVGGISMIPNCKELLLELLTKNDLMKGPGLLVICSLCVFSYCTFKLWEMKRSLLFKPDTATEIHDSTELENQKYVTMQGLERIKMYYIKPIQKRKKGRKKQPDIAATIFVKCLVLLGLHWSFAEYYDWTSLESAGWWWWAQKAGWREMARWLRRPRRGRHLYHCHHHHHCRHDYRFHHKQGWEYCV